MRSLIANNPDDPEFEPDDENSRKLVWERDFEDSMVVGFTRLGI
jgi:hypothetical protein